MRRTSLRPALLVAACSSIALAACAAGSNNNNFTGGAGGTMAMGGGGAGASTSASSGQGLGGGSFTSSSSGTGGAAPMDVTAYAHTGTVLFSLDPMAPMLGLKQIGAFDCIDKNGTGGKETAMTDLAVSQSGEIWGISYSNVYRLEIQGSVVHCAQAIALNNPNKIVFYGLTFAPAGVLDPNKEVLIAGNTAGELWAIDDNGNLTQHGTFGKVPQTDGNGHDYQNAGKSWELSGDLVFLSNGGNPVGFATVRDCPSPPSTTGCNATDTLVQIDMTKLKSTGTQAVISSVRGQILQKPGCGGASTAYENMLGIAAWNDKVYGFSHKGSIVEIDNTDGSACQVVDTPTDYWNGAGLTTSAPVKPPPA